MQELEEQFKEIRIQVPWGHVAGKMYGEPSLPPVLLVHGTLDNAGSFNRLLKYLPKEFHYVSIDLPGHGFSSHLPEGLPLQFFDYVRVIKLVLDGLAWQTCIYMGHSLGAMLGFAFNAMYPNRITKIVGLDSFLLPPVEMDEIIPRLQERYDLESYTGETGKLYTKEHVMHALQHKRHYSLNIGAAEMMFQRTVTKVGDLYRYNRDPRLRKTILHIVSFRANLEFIRDFKIPALLVLQKSVYTTLTKSYLTEAKNMNVNLDTVKVVYLNGNHDGHNNEPEPVALHICKFLRGDLNSKL